MVKTMHKPGQKTFMGRLNPEPEPMSAKFEETCRELEALNAAHKKYTTRKQAIEDMKKPAPKVKPEDDNKRRAPPAFADGTSAVINKRRRRP